MIHPQKANENSLHNINDNPELKVQIQNQPQPQPVKEQERKCPLSTCKIVAIVVSIFLVLLGIGLAVGLTLGAKTTITLVSTPTSLTFDDGSSMGIAQYKLTQDFIIQQDIEITFTIASIPIPTSRRLLQQQISEADYTTYIDIPDTGIVIAVDEDRCLQLSVDADQLQAYILKTEPEASRLLAEGDVVTGQELTVAEIQAELSQAVDEEFSKTGEFQFKETLIVEFDLNVESHTFEMITQDTTDNATVSRRLLTNRQLYKRIIKKPIKKIVASTIKPTLDMVKENGKLIADAAGGLATVKDGPKNVASGISLGKSVSAKSEWRARTALNACSPRNSTRIRCRQDSLNTTAVSTSTDGTTDPTTTKKCKGRKCPRVRKPITSKQVNIQTVA